MMKISKLISTYHNKKKSINPKFISDYEKFCRNGKSATQRFQLSWEDIYPCSYDNKSETLFDTHYIYHKADLVNLNFKSNSIQSMSCMHVIEHIGLGRYGDPLDYDGDLKAINELKRVMAKGGNLLFVVPIGQPKIEFNAHRIYSFDQIKSYFKEFEIKEFSIIPDNALLTGIIFNADKDFADKQEYACGCFWFQK